MDKTIYAGCKKHFMSDSEVKVSDLLESIPQIHTEEKIRFGDLAKDLHEQGIPLLIAFFAIPVCIPIPYPPGFSTAISITIAIFAIQLFKQRPELWLPKWANEKSLSRETVVKMLARAVPKLRWMERRFKESWLHLCSSRSEKIIALIVLFNNILIAIPIPGVHFFPGWSIMIMCLGLINRDGRVVAIGMCVAVFGVFFAAGEIFLGEKLIESILHHT